MSTKLLNDVASILAEVGVSRQLAENVFVELGQELNLEESDIDILIDIASNANPGGECSC